MRTLPRISMLLATTLLVAACGDDDGAGTGPMIDDTGATVIGQVEFETSSAQMNAASGAAATTATVAQVTSSGELVTLAEADVEADGSFRIEGVPSDRTDLVVTAQTDAQIVGQALVHGRTAEGVVMTTAPINAETTLEAMAFAEARASGSADHTSAAEMALLLHTGAQTRSVIASADVVADGIAAAGRTLTSVYAEAGTSLDASARADLMSSAAVAHAENLFGGVALETAHEIFAEATLDAFADVDVDARATATATAAAATVLDASVQSVQARGRVMLEPVRLNLKARSRLAAEARSSGQADVALEIENLLAATEAEVEAATSASELRIALENGGTARADAIVSATLDALIPGATAAMRALVAAEAEEAFASASLRSRFDGVATADAAASATADYEADVRAAVDAMLEAAGRTDVDAETMTSLFIAAGADARIR